ncbi:unknown [Bacteroides sp. CAG:530]|nr:unknown [Bacteroides sp. CAG:530]
MQVLPELLSCYKVVLNVDWSVKSILLIKVIQYTVKYNEQLLLIVYDALLVNQMQISRFITLHYCHLLVDSACPVYLVIASMKILYGEENKVTVLLIKADKRQHNIQISIGFRPFSLSGLWQTLVKDNLALRIGLIEHVQRPINPYRKLIDKLSVFIAQLLLSLRSQYLLRLYRFACRHRYTSQHLLVSFVLQ